VVLKVIGAWLVVSAKGTPNSKSLTMTAAKSLKKRSSSFAYFSIHCLKALSETRAISVGSIIKVLVVLSSYCWFVSCCFRKLKFGGTYLLGTIPLLPVPLLVQEKLVVLVCHNCWGECPWTRETTSVGVAATQGVSTAQSNDLLVIEAHSVKNVSQVLVSLATIWEASIWCAGSNVLVQSAGSVWDGRALHFLNRDHTSKDPKIRVGDPWELFYYELSASVFQLR
jgi:hypothetical protein